MKASGGILDIPVVRQLSEIAQSQHTNIYLVGGAVRDSFLGLVPTDIDIMVEGNALRFANIVQNIWKGTRQMKMSQYGRFRSAKIFLKNFNIDIGTAHKNVYDENVVGGSPTIVPVDSITEDLMYRDVTINAIAVSLNEDYGKIIDPTRGMDDLKNKLIRIIWNVEFNHDPARMFRIVRLAGRLGFEITDTSKKIIAEAIQGGALNRIDVNKLNKELSAMPSESALRQGLGMLKAISGRPHMTHQRAGKIKVLW
jgi:tRNA nucleotidyltransferase (CCA-adding enzyme)